MSCRHIYLYARTLTLISICILVLAAAMVWTRLEQAGSPCQFDWPGCAESTVPDRNGGSVKPAATITVNSTSDAANATDGLCTLREAITAANTDAQSGAVAGECIAGSGADTIAFNIPGSGVKTITPATVLPDITDQVLIDGYSQPGASQNTLANGENA